MSGAAKPTGRQGPEGRQGILGGTFNPVHLAHLRVAEEVAEALGLAAVRFVPSAAPPHKDASAGSDPLAPAERRLAWLRAATAGNPRFTVDPLEVERGGTSYSVDTLRELAKTLGARPVFLIGWDAFVEIDAWKDPATLFRLADFAVMTRPPATAASLEAFVPECIRDDLHVAPDGRSAELRETGGWIRLVEVTPLGVSSSGIRRRLREGRTVRYLLPEGAHDAIVESGVYGPKPAPRAAREDR